VAGRREPRAATDDATGLNGDGAAGQSSGGPGWGRGGTPGSSSARAGAGRGWRNDAAVRRGQGAVVRR
jgi:hypothetical protein